MDSIILSIPFGAFSEDLLSSDQKEAVGAKREQNGVRAAFHPFIIMIRNFDSDSSSGTTWMRLILLFQTQVSFVNRKC